MLIFVLALLVASGRGNFALHYGPPVLTPKELAWYGRFDVLVTHDCLPRDQVKALRAGGTKLFFYEWSVAFYASRAGEWEQSLIARKSPLLLNQRPLHGGAGSADGDAYYFDPTNAHGREMRARLLAERMRQCGYDGIFFDTTRFENVHPTARETFKRRHEATSYDVEFSKFLQTLKAQPSHPLIFTNQGFQDAANYNRWADWDLSESLVTVPQNGSFVARKWNDRNDLWNSTRFLMQQLIEPVTKRFPNARIAHVNYVKGYRRDLIHLVVATAHLFGGEGYVVGSSVAEELDDIYFWRPGKPSADRVDTRNGDVSYRVFEHGVVIVNGGAAPFKLDPSLLPGQRYENLTTRSLLPSRSALEVPAALNGQPVAYLFRRVE